MSKLKLIIIALLAANLLLLGLEAAKPPLDMSNDLQAGTPQADPLPGIRLLSELADVDSEQSDLHGYLHRFPVSISLRPMFMVR